MLQFEETSGLFDWMLQELGNSKNRKKLMSVGVSCLNVHYSMM